VTTTDQRRALQTAAFPVGLPQMKPHPHGSRQIVRPMSWTLPCKLSQAFHMPYSVSTLSRSTSVLDRFDRTAMDGQGYEFRCLHSERLKASRQEVTLDIVDSCCLLLVALKRTAGQPCAGIEALASAIDEVWPRPSCSTT
jgi:hypothetical protein